MANMQLLEAACAGDVDAMEQSLRDGADQDYQGERGTAILVASAKDRIDIVKKLVEVGANVNKGTKGGYTEAMVAAVNGHIAVLDEILKAGADVELEESRGMTALFLAASVGKTDAGVRLLRALADVNHTDRRGQTPLMAATKRGHTDFVDLLIIAGADVDIQDELGDTALHIALEESKFDVVVCLLEAGCVSDHANKVGQTPLMYAAAAGHLALVEQLLDAGADVLKEDNEGHTAFSFAARHDATHVPVALRLLHAKTTRELQRNVLVPSHVGAVSEYVNTGMLVGLVRASVDPQLRFKDGTTLLHTAAMWHGQVLQRLDPDLSIMGITAELRALYEAEGTTSIDIFQCLLAAGADVDAHNKDGQTVLIMAVIVKDLTLVDIILAHKPNLKLSDKAGKTAYLHAIVLKSVDVRKEMISKLTSADADAGKPIWDGNIPSLINAIKMNTVGRRWNYYSSLEAEQLEAKDEGGSTALLLAVKMQLPGAVSRLLNLKVCTETTDHNGWTPLIAAIVMGDLQVVKILLKAGVDIEHSDLDFKTPLFIAAELDMIDIFKELLLWGAVIHKTDKSGRAALDVANCEEIVDLLQMRTEREARMAEDDLSLAVEEDRFNDMCSTMSGSTSAVHTLNITAEELSIHTLDVRVDLPPHY